MMRRRAPSLASKVKKRDHYKCRLCFAKQDLEAHHLFGQKRYPELKKNMNNLITLCHQCHQRFHTFCPHGRNTNRDFLEFLDHIHMNEENNNAKNLINELQQIVANLEKQVTNEMTMNSKQGKKSMNAVQRKINKLLDIDMDM